MGKKYSIDGITKSTGDNDPNINNEHGSFYAM